jgi:hypothetical protein
MTVETSPLRSLTQAVGFERNRLDIVIRPIQCLRAISASFSTTTQPRARIPARNVQCWSETSDLVVRSRGFLRHDRNSNFGQYSRI